MNKEGSSNTSGSEEEELTHSGEREVYVPHTHNVRHRDIQQSLGHASTGCPAGPGIKEEECGYFALFLQSLLPPSSHGAGSDRGAHSRWTQEWCHFKDGDCVCTEQKPEQAVADREAVAARQQQEHLCVRPGQCSTPVHTDLHMP